MARATSRPAPSISSTRGHRTSIPVLGVDRRELRGEPGRLQPGLGPHPSRAELVVVIVDVVVDGDGDVNDSAQRVRCDGRWEGMLSFQRLDVYRCAIDL